MKFFLFLFAALVSASAKDNATIIRKANADLTAAVDVGDFTAVKKAVEAGANPNVPMDEYGVTGVMIAAQDNNWQIVDYLLSKGANLEAVDNEGSTVLHLLCGPNDVSSFGLAAIKETLKRVPSFPVNMQELNQGNTALHFACANGHLETVKFLVERKASIASRNSLQNTPILAAISGNKANAIEIVDYLIANGANPLSEVNRDGDNGMILAILENSLPMVKRMVELIKPVPDAVNTAIVAAVAQAESCKHIAIIEYLKGFLPDAFTMVTIAKVNPVVASAEQTGSVNIQKKFVNMTIKKE